MLVGMLAKLIDFGTAGRPLPPPQDSKAEDAGSAEVSGEDGRDPAPDAEAGSGSSEERQAPPPAPEVDSGDAIPRPEQA